MHVPGSSLYPGETHDQEGYPNTMSNIDSTEREDPSEARTADAGEMDYERTAGQTLDAHVM